MLHPSTVPVFALLAVLGVGAGVHLGHAAVDEINPVYFSDPAGTPSYAALTPARSLGVGEGFAPAPPEPAVVSCVGCLTYPEEYYPRRDAAVDAAVSARRAAPPEEATVEIYSVPPPPEPAPAIHAIETYAYYPIEEDDYPVAEPGEDEEADGWYGEDAEAGFESAS